MALLSILLIFILVVYSIHADNPTAIVAPYNGSDPGYIIASSDAGLSNRLRVLASYMYISEKLYKGAHLVFVWDVNDACPGHFLQLFKPLDKVIFSTNASVPALYSRAHKIFQVTNWPLKSILQVHHVSNHLHAWIEYEQYLRFIPNPLIMHKVNLYVSEHNICNHSAMHIRSTDMEKLLGTKRSPGNLEKRLWYIEGKKPGEKVFLLTDSPKMQNKIIDIFPEKILVYKKMTNVSDQIPLSSWAKHLIGETKATKNITLEDKTFPREHRFTTLEHTLIDVLIAAHAKEFRGSPFSSLSDLVTHFSKAGKSKWGWCKF